MVDVGVWADFEFMQSGTNLSGTCGTPRLRALPLRFPLGGGLLRGRGLFEPAAGILLRLLQLLPLAGPGAPEAVVALYPLRVEKMLPTLAPLLDRLQVGFALSKSTEGTLGTIHKGRPHRWGEGE